jgi:hypothetical protein
MPRSGAREFARGARAESTWATYEGKWGRFTRWCAEHAEIPLPADPLTVARFVTDLAPHWRPSTPADAAADIVITPSHVLIRPGLRPSSITGYLAAISVAHQGLSIPVLPDTAATTDTVATATAPATAGAGAGPTRLSTTRSGGCLGVGRYPPPPHPEPVAAA